MFLRESLNHPLILIFEDLHWIDTETQGFLDTLSGSVASARILLLVNYRPEYRQEWGSKTYYTQLRLSPLGREEAAELLTFLLGTDPGLKAVQPLIDEYGNIRRERWRDIGKIREAMSAELQKPAADWPKIDGLIDQMMVLHDPETAGTDAYVRIYNVDGSEVGACGNGLRCVSWVVAAETGREELKFETRAGVLEARVLNVGRIGVDMGAPRFD